MNGCNGEQEKPMPATEKLEQVLEASREVLDAFRLLARTTGDDRDKEPLESDRSWESVLPSIIPRGVIS